MVVFQGRLNGPGFRDACDRFLLPFIREKYPEFHQLHMDNAPSHAAVATTAYLEESGVFHFKTPAQSPDLNAIELVWHDLKKFIKEVIKPTTSAQLLQGILTFWDTIVDVEYCNSKIDHVQYRVIDEILRLKGKPTGL